MKQLVAGTRTLSKSKKHMVGFLSSHHSCKKSATANSPSSQASGEKQYQHDDHNQTQPTARVIAPRPAVRPSGECAQQKQNQNHQEYCVHKPSLLESVL